MSKVTTLYRKTAYGIGEWSIWIDYSHSEQAIIKITHSVTLDGVKQLVQEAITSGKQGRTIFQQAEHRMQSRINLQKDKGYVESIDKAAGELLNQLGLPQPMLAKTVDADINVNGLWIQRKLNGLRCLVTRKDGKLIAYSRRGKEFIHIQHILAELENVVEEGIILDGELYVHGTPLQTIQSWIKREQPENLKVKYFVYDQMSSRQFYERHDQLIEQFNGLSNILILPKRQVDHWNEVHEAFDKARLLGFEGLMIRSNRIGYESGKRSYSLLKYKAAFDGEAICKAIVLSEKGNPVLILDYEGKELRASPPGTVKQRLHCFDYKESYIGRRVTIEYRELTNDGIPFHAVAIGWRND